MTVSISRRLFNSYHFLSRIISLQLFETEVKKKMRKDPAVADVDDLAHVSALADKEEIMALENDINIIDRLWSFD